MTVGEFLRAIFQHAEGKCYFQSLGNSLEDNERPRELITRNAAELEPFVRKWDRPGRGLFVAVSTLRDGAHRRTKDTVWQYPALHADLDFKGMELDETEPDKGGDGEPGGDMARRVLVRLRSLPCPPSIVVNSGHGLHCYWLLKEPLDLVETPDLIDRIEESLRLLADVLAGDPAVCEVSRLMRLPGTHNTKRGGFVPVEIVSFDPDRRYELADIEDMLAILPPIFKRKEALDGGNSATGTSPSENIWQQQAKLMGFKPPLDVDAALASMTYGGGPTGVHQTQLSVTAALLNRGMAVDDVVSFTLEATRARVGDAGRRWNWRREEENVRSMCQTWLDKHPRKEQIVEVGEGEGVPDEQNMEAPVAGEPLAEPPRLSVVGGGSRDRGAAGGPAGVHGPDEPRGEGGAVVNLGSSHAAVAARKKAPAKAEDTDAASVVIGGVLAAVEAAGERLLLTEGALWFYRNGLWRRCDAADEQRLKVKIQEGFRALGVKAKPGVLAQAWKFLTEHPDLYRERVVWGSGKLVCDNGVLDLDTGAFGPHDPEHYARTKLGAAYDPDADCPRVKELLASMFEGVEDGADIVALIQEFAGFGLAPHRVGRSGRKANTLLGGSRTGKTEVAQLLRLLWVGEGAQLASCSIADLNDRFGLQPLLGAAAWIRDDAINEGDKIDPQRFKVIVTGERTTVRLVGAGTLDVEFCLPVLLTANALPRVRDQTDALFNRSIVIPMDRVVSEEEAAAWQRANGCPPHLRPIEFLWKEEAAGVLNWALEGLWRLLERGGVYHIPETCKLALQRFKDDNNPVSEWARQAIRRDPDKMVSRADLLCSMHGWQREMEGDEARAFGARAFFPRLRALIPSLSEKQSHNGARYLVGLSLTDVGLTSWQSHKEHPLRGGSSGSSIDKGSVNARAYPYRGEGEPEF